MTSPVQAVAGGSVTLFGDFYVAGVLADPDSVTLDITYGSVLGVEPDVAGPFSYSGASTDTPGQVWRITAGAYAFTWQLPSSALAGDYVANWTFTLDDVPYLATENIWVTGTAPAPVPSGDTGYWTGGIIYPAAGLDIEFGQVDANGTAWLWQKLTGWDGAALQGAGVIPRSGDHGAWASPQYFAARTMTFTCTASAQSQALRDVARSTLQQAVPVSDLAVLRYDEPIPKQCLVRRAGQLTEAYPTLADVTFTVPFVAPDMRKYGTVQKQLPITAVPPGPGGDFVIPFSIPFSLAASAPPAGAYAVNNGNFGSPPLAVITGPCAGPVLANLTTGEQVSWSGVVIDAGQTLTVDFLNRQAWLGAPNPPGLPGQSLGGGSYEPADIFSAWFDLNPGSNLLQFTAASTGTGAACVFHYFDAWS